MTDEITVHHKVVRVKMPPAQKDVRLLRCTSQYNGGIKGMKGLGGGSPFCSYLEFKRIGPEGLSPQPVNTLGYGRKRILKAFAEAKKTLEQHLWETK